MSGTDMTNALPPATHAGLRRTCAELGICQCKSPACEECASPALVAALNAAPVHNRPWDTICYYGAIAIMGTVAVVLGVAGYLYTRFGG